jgi:Ni/Co efflux regulator RcnB
MRRFISAVIVLNLCAAQLIAQQAAKDYEKAVASNQRSLQADRDFQKEWGERATPTLGTYGMSSRTHARHAWDLFVMLQCTPETTRVRWKQRERRLPGRRIKEWAAANVPLRLRYCSISVLTWLIDEAFNQEWRQ